MNESRGVPDGVRIAGFGRVPAAPYATMQLADPNAEVVKVERPGGGDETRTWGPPWSDDGEATYFLSVNRDRTQVLDLRTDEGCAGALALVDSADVVVEDSRTGTIDRLGLGYDTSSQLNRGSAYCSVTGFGPHEGADPPGWFGVLTEAGAPAGPIDDVPQPIAPAQRLGLDPVRKIADPARSAPVRQVADPITLSATPATYRVAPPLFVEPFSEGAG